MLLNNIRRIVGKENVTDEQEDLLAYAYDASPQKGEALGVVLPTSIDHVSKVMDLCYRYGYNVVIRGGGTGLVGGAVPQRELVMDMTRLIDVHVDVQNKEARVGPGMVCRRLNKILKQNGLFFPVVPSSDAVATIGGMIATNAQGNRALRFGSTRDWIKKLKIVTSSGELIETSEVDDFCGKEGVTGIIVEATLKLTNSIENTSITLREFDTIKDLTRAVKDLAQLPHVLALELLNEHAARLVGFETNVLLVEYDNEGGEITKQEEVAQLWAKREGIYPELAARGLTTITDPKVSLEKMNDFLFWLDSKSIPAFGHVGIGVVHACFSQEQGEDVERMYEFVKNIEGEPTGEHGYGVLKKKYVPPRYKYRVRVLKNIYNKKGILNRGRIV
ncbi:hypothetical protein COT72_02500 [archaeon CG10_big_fil_rev_8_21_14_0_10_43_11]|nr:MAG: hypothetical protein COT72_02500 [archaeon CG10_big_fil_rev_8_21_14_0_10_43_11]